MTTAQDILDDASDAIRDRSKYRDSNGEKSFELAAKLASNLLDKTFTATDVCFLLAMVKLARAVRGDFHTDDFTDAASYIALACESRAGEVRPSRRLPTTSNDLPQIGDDGWRPESDVSGRKNSVGMQGLQRSKTQEDGE